MQQSIRNTARDRGNKAQTSRTTVEQVAVPSVCLSSNSLRKLSTHRSARRDSSSSSASTAAHHESAVSRNQHIRVDPHLLTTSYTLNVPARAPLVTEGMDEFDLLLSSESENLPPPPHSYSRAGSGFSWHSMRRDSEQHSSRPTVAPRPGTAPSVGDRHNKSVEGRHDNSPIWDGPQHPAQPFTPDSAHVEFSIPPPLVLIRNPACDGSTDECAQSSASSSASVLSASHRLKPTHVARFVQALQSDDDTWTTFRKQLVESLQRLHPQQRSQPASQVAQAAALPPRIPTTAALPVLHIPSSTSAVVAPPPTVAPLRKQPPANQKPPRPTTKPSQRTWPVSSPPIVAFQSVTKRELGTTVDVAYDVSSTSADSGRKAPAYRRVSHRRSCRSNTSTCTRNSGSTDGSGSVLSSLRSSEVNQMWERESSWSA